MEWAGTVEEVNSNGSKIFFWECFKVSKKIEQIAALSCVRRENQRKTTGRFSNRNEGKAGGRKAGLSEKFNRNLTNL